MKRATHLDSVEARSRLKPRRDPYWQRLSEGRYIGFRKMTARSAGSWLARYYDGAKYPQDPLGDFDDLDEGKRYDAAVRAATEWFKHKGAGGSTRTITVRGACELYLQHVREPRARVGPRHLGPRVVGGAEANEERRRKP